MVPGLGDEILQLGEQGFFLRDAFLGEPEARAMAAEAERLAKEGAFTPAGVSRGADRRVDLQVRGDETCWLAPDTYPRLHAAFDQLRRDLNAGAYLGLGRFDLQLARYAGAGEGYQRHRDAFTGGPTSRRLTATWYLNPGWRPEHGGVLRLHLPSGPLDVEPRLDRLVVFRSEQVEHEVIPARAPRHAATAWYYGPL
ncbi:MAG TPA: 2OG-Fe(II) oxygenase [Myxococcales bacterium]|nr:2OG-Fe(II) oxygenase [Myxococcales bacterium]